MNKFTDEGLPFLHEKGSNPTPLENPILSDFKRFRSATRTCLRPSPQKWLILANSHTHWPVCE